MTKVIKANFTKFTAANASGLQSLDTIVEPELAQLFLGIQVFQFFSLFAADVPAFAGQPLELFLLCSLEEAESVQGIAEQNKKKDADDGRDHPNPDWSGMCELFVDDCVRVVHCDF